MDEVSVFEAIAIVWRRKLLILGLVVVATVSAYLISAAQPSVYQAETTLVIPSARPGVGIPGLGGLSQAMGRLPTLAGALDALPSSTSVLMPLMRSRTLAERVVRACGLLREYHTGSLQGATGQLMADTAILQEPTSGEIVLSVKAKQPEMAAEIANSYVRELQPLAEGKIDLSMMHRSRAFVNERLADAKARLTRAEEQLREFQERHRIVALPEEARAAVNQIATLEQDRTATQVTLTQTEAQIRERRRQIEAQTSQPLEDLPAHSPIIQNWRDKLVTLNSRLTLARQELTEESPTVQSLEAQIAETRNQLQQELGRVRGALAGGLAPELTLQEAEQIAQEARLEAIRGAVHQAQQRFEQLPERSLQLARLERERAVQDGIYSYLRSEKEKIDLDAARQGPAFVVLDAAIVPEGRISPRPQLMAMLAALLSFMVAATLAFFAEHAERARYAREKRAYLAQEANGASPGPPAPELAPDGRREVVDVVDRVTR